jgi:hypothetical protein
MFHLQIKGKTDRKQGGYCRVMRPETGIDNNRKGSEIKGIFEDGLQRDLSMEENLLINNWVQHFNKEERATIINMMKELVNKHKRHD